MGLARRCTKTGCGGAAVATLTYVYRDSTVVVGPLATFAEPHTYDLCANHADRLTVPRGWEVVRLSGEYVQPAPTEDDLLALADAVREAGRPRRSGDDRGVEPTPIGQAGSARPGTSASEQRSGAVEVSRRGHLRVLRDG